MTGHSPIARPRPLLVHFPGPCANPSDTRSTDRSIDGRVSEVTRGGCGAGTTSTRSFGGPARTRPAHVGRCGGGATLESATDNLRDHAETSHVPRFPVTGPSPLCASLSTARPPALHVHHELRLGCGSTGTAQGPSDGPGRPARNSPASCTARPAIEGYKDPCPAPSPLYRHGRGRSAATRHLFAPRGDTPRTNPYTGQLIAATRRTVRPTPRAAGGRGTS